MEGKPDHTQSSSTARVGWLSCLRRRALVVFFAFVLAFGAAAPRPAHAIVGIDDAIINYIGAALTPASWAQSMASSIIISIRAYLHTLMEAFRMRTQRDTAIIEETFRNEVARLSLQARLQVEDIPSPTQSTCRAATANMRATRTAAEGAGGAVDVQALIEARGLGISVPTLGAGGTPGGATGGGAGGAGGGRTPDEIVPRPNGNATASSIDLARHACRYDAPSEANVRRCTQLGVPESQIGMYVGLDRRPDVLLDAAAFDTQEHQQAATDFCNNLTLNRQFEISSPATALQSSDNIRVNRGMYAEAAAMSLAQLLCSTPLADRRPPEFSAPNASGSTNIYAPLQRLGWQPVINISTWPPAAEEGDETPTWASYSASLQYIPGRAPSPLQARMIADAQLLDVTRMVGTAGSTDQPPRHMIYAKAVTLRQNMERLRMLEQQVLIAAAKLARKVRRGGAS